MVRYSRHERGEDGRKRISEAPVKKIGAQRVDGAAVGAAEAPDPEGAQETFKISPDIAVSPDAGRLAGEAALRSGPWISFAKLK